MSFTAPGPLRVMIPVFASLLKVFCDTATIFTPPFTVTLFVTDALGALMVRDDTEPSPLIVMVLAFSAFTVKSPRVASPRSSVSTVT